MNSSSINHFRPPAVPLVTCDPYFCVWSMSDCLTDEWPSHWTGASNALSGIARIDGKAYKFMGPEPKREPAMIQVGLQVLPTRTIYDFEAGGVRITVIFMTPLLPNDLDILARPITYITWQPRSTGQILP